MLAQKRGSVSTPSLCGYCSSSSPASRRLLSSSLNRATMSSVPVASVTDAAGSGLGPVGPVGPVAPASPVGPVGPVAPTAPASPVGPVGPVAPTAPASPVGPVGPVAPTAPASPVGPVGPVAPVGPVGPVTPSAPVAPVGPVGPIIPGKPGGPGGPGMPLGPIGPISPRDPREPGGPGGPIGPGRPLPITSSHTRSCQRSFGRSQLPQRSCRSFMSFFLSCRFAGNLRQFSLCRGRLRGDALCGEIASVVRHCRRLRPHECCPLVPCVRSVHIA